MTLQADRESDRKIAERLGLEVVKVFDGSGLSMRDPERVTARDLPYYTTSVDAAMELIANHNIGITIRSQFGNLWDATIENYEDPDNNYVGWSNNSPALAVCRAWWAWMNAKESEE